MRLLCATELIFSFAIVVERKTGKFKALCNRTQTDDKSTSAVENSFIACYARSVNRELMASFQNKLSYGLSMLFLKLMAHHKVFRGLLGKMKMQRIVH